MPVVIPISDWITYAKITQYLFATNAAKNRIFNGGNLSSYYGNILRVTRCLVETAYNRNPNDETLNETGLFLRSLIDEQSAVIIVANGGCVSPVIVTNPISQSISSGSNVTFTVNASGTSLTYQWKKDGVSIGGATNSVYTITGAVTGDAGAYSCVVTNGCGSATSTSATLTVAAVSITGSYYYGGTDYFAALSGGTDAISYQGTFSITHDAAISVPYPTAANTNMYLVVRVPVGESLKSTWYNTALNNGSIPDSAFRDALNPAGLPLYTYYLSRVQVSNDFTNPLILS